MRHELSLFIHELLLFLLEHMLLKARPDEGIRIALRSLHKQCRAGLFLVLVPLEGAGQRVAFVNYVHIN